MNRRYLAAIGLTVVIALAIVIRALIFLHPSPGDGGRQIHVRFQNVDKISSGTRVTFAGKPVGEVVQVQLLPEVFDIRAQDSRPIYSYEVVLSIDSSVRVYKSDEICVSSEGLMGERVIAITPKPLPEGGELRLIGPADIVFAMPSGSAEEMLREITVFAQKADVTIDTLGQASAQLNALLTALNNDHFAEKLNAIGDKSISCLETINTLTKKLTETAHGQGTLGRLMNDATLYDSLLQCSLNTNRMIADINTYGLLFHTNRDWQREMHRRADELVAQSAPAFRTTRDQLQKISEIITDLNATFTNAQKCHDHDSVKNNQALRDELTKGLNTVQQQLNTLAETVRKASLDPISEVANEENAK
jgi:phospholipid/cholesterol/gamma-HCH transport system substrate-binding protein